MAEHGGYRKPSKPAATSGPGALSQRTDGRPQPVRDLPNADYGEAGQFREIQQGAALASAPQATTPAGGAGADPLAGMGDFAAETGMPDVPVTDGADAGLGAGTDALNLPGRQADSQFMARYLPLLLRAATRDDAAPGLKKAVRTLIAQM